MSSLVFDIAQLSLSVVGAFYIFNQINGRKEKSWVKEVLQDSNDDDGKADNLITSLILQENEAISESIDDPSHCCIYLDYNGTTPVYREVLIAMIPYLTSHFGNPSSSHAFGMRPKTAVRQARIELAEFFLGETCRDSSNREHIISQVADSIIFTGCGTESDNLAITLALGSCPGVKGKKKHIVTSNVEHPAVEECLKNLEAKGEIEVTRLPVDEKCLVCASDVSSAIRSDGSTCLVTIILANNEIGSVFPCKEIAQICRESNVLFHTDAAQAVGKIATDFDALGHPDMITIVGHKFGAPKGVAALYVRDGCLVNESANRTEPFLYNSSGGLLFGGGQESGRRAGTENVPYIVGMGKAVSLLSGGKWQSIASHTELLRDKLLSNLIERLGADNVHVNGPNDAKKQLPNTLSVGLRNVRSGDLLQRVQQYVAASAGSACHSAGGGVSPVLLAMKVPKDFASGTIRLSVGRDTTLDDVNEAAAIISREVKKQWENSATLQ